MIFLPCGVVLLLWGLYELRTQPLEAGWLSSGGCGLVGGVVFLIVGILCLLIGAGI